MCEASFTLGTQFYQVLTHTVDPSSRGSSKSIQHPQPGVLIQSRRRVEDLGPLPRKLQSRLIRNYLAVFSIIPSYLHQFLYLLHLAEILMQCQWYPCIHHQHTHTKACLPHGQATLWYASLINQDNLLLLQHQLCPSQVEAVLLLIALFKALFTMTWAQTHVLPSHHLIAVFQALLGGNFQHVFSVMARLPRP